LAPHAPESQSSAIAFSYAPKKNSPPMVIQPTRGWMPLKSAPAPSSRAIVRSVSIVPLYAAPLALFAPAARGRAGQSVRARRASRRRTARTEHQPRLDDVERRRHRARKGAGRRAAHGALRDANAR
jgi:hypothetical protein